MSDERELSIVTDDDREKRVEALHRQIAATQELPVERTASRWIGEAEAVAADLVGADVPADVLRERVGHVQELLANVEETEHSAADDHVAEAERIAGELLDRLSDE